MTVSLDLARTALLIIDLQNDFLHPDGAYGRAGQSAEAIAAPAARRAVHLAPSEDAPPVPVEG